MVIKSELRKKFWDLIKNIVNTVCQNIEGENSYQKCKKIYQHFLTKCTIKFDPKVHSEHVWHFTNVPDREFVIVDENNEPVWYITQISLPEKHYLIRVPESNLGIEYFLMAI